MAEPSKRTPDLQLKLPVFVLSLSPLLWLAYRARAGQLGANPVDRAINALGWWALVLLLLSLAATPAQQVLGWSAPLRVRRMLGLFAFFYASVHLAVYAGLDQDLDWELLLSDVATHKFILLGFAAWALMVPLALTSTQRMLQRLRFARWKALHRLAYVSATLGVVHFWMGVKHDVTEPALFGLVFAALMAARWVKRRAPKVTPAAPGG